MMEFYEAVRQVLELLQRQGRVAYRALKRQFDLEDDYLEDLKEAILYTHPQVVDDEGRGLVWTGDPATPEPDAQRRAEAESRFHALLPDVMGLLQRERRVTYRRLTYVFGLDDALLEEIRKELTFRQLAVDEDGKGLVWTGESQPAVQPAVAIPSQSATADTTVVVSSPAAPTLSPPVTETSTPSHGPTVPAEAISSEALQDEPAVTPEPTRSAPEAERRQLTVMFCDLADSTKLSQQLDPEDLREVIRAYQQTSNEVIQHFEGYIAQHLGDGLLIYFGWPKAHEDDAQRALHAGLGIVDAITTTLNPRLEQDKGVKLAVRIGIHTGPVVVGEMGGGGRHENLATGETVNIASRLEGLAAPNTVVISHVTARLVQDAFALEDLGLHTLKGVAEPMHVFRVLGPTEVHEDETATVGVPFLVGRDEEMGLLLRRWEQSKEGVGQVVLISGEAGIGKSSLVETLRANVRDDGATRIVYRCSPYYTNSALYPIIAHLERVLRLDRDDTPEAKLTKLEGVLQSYTLELDEVVPLFAALLSVPLSEERSAPLTLTPQQQKQYTLDALTAWLLAEAERRPLLVVWEDLHWADPSTLEMLGLVLEQTPTVPILHALTFRPEFAPPWPTRSHMTPITLNRLERPQVEALITHLEGGKALPGEVVQYIVAKTDGVPLYVEELIKMLLESDLLREEADHYELTGPLSTVAIPDTLQDSLMARLDQLSTAKEVAQLGAVLGREFPYDLIQAISSQDDETLQAGLTKLVEAELLYQRGRPPRARYIFKHALIQDAAYASLLRSRRQQIHQQIARTFEEKFPEVIEAQPELVAQHYTEAGLHEQATAYWQQAGERAIQRSANAEAVGHLKKGLEVLTTRPDTSERTRQALHMLTALGPALVATKGYAASEVGQVYTRARELCQQVGEAPELFRVLRGLWAFYGVRGPLQTALDVGTQLLSFAQRHDDPALDLEAHAALGFTHLYMGTFVSARTHLEQARALHDPYRHRDHALLYGHDPGIACRGWAAMTLWLQGYPDQSLALDHEALSLAHELPHPFSRALGNYLAARLHQCRRDVQATQERVESFMALSREHGFTHFLSAGMIFQGWILAMEGQEAAGLPQMRQGLDAWQAMGAELNQAYWLALLTEVYVKGRQVGAGLTALTEALSMMDKVGERFYEAEIHRLRGELLLQRQTPDEQQPEICFHHALDISRQQQAKSWELRVATSLARLWREQSKRQEAHDLLAPVYGWFTEGFDTADLQDAKTLLDELA